MLANFLLHDIYIKGAKPSQGHRLKKQFLKAVFLIHNATCKVGVAYRVIFSFIQNSFVKNG